MHVAHPHPDGLKIFGEILRHPLGEGRYQHALILGFTLTDLGEEIVHLAFDRSHIDGGVHEPGRADDLLHHHAP